MTCNSLEIEYDFVVVDILAGEHKKPEYTKVSYAV
jgi:glutathione S-transferase